MMSRVHAKIEAEVDSNTGNYVSYSIEDKSLNGTYVNDTRVSETMSIKQYEDHFDVLIRLGIL